MDWTGQSPNRDPIKMLWGILNRQLMQGNPRKTSDVRDWWAVMPTRLKMALPVSRVRVVIIPQHTITSIDTYFC